jgi:hypothetical protein
MRGYNDGLGGEGGEEEFRRVVELLGEWLFLKIVAQEAVYVLACGL